MALTDESNGNGFYMPVAPAYGGGYGNGGFGGFGGDGWWVLLLLLAFNGGWGNGFGGGFGGGLGYDFPWLLNGQNGINANTNAGFDHAATQAAIGDLSTAVTTGFGNVATQLCGGFAGVNATVNGAQNAISQQLYSNEIASLNRSFAEQTANTAGFTATNTGIADLKYTIASEACADRAAVTAGIQTVLDKLCALELDSYKRENDNLRQQLNMADLRASQTAQNAFISQGFANEVDALYNRLNSCPVPTTPVYGRTPIFTCPQQVNNCGCGCGGNF